MWEEGGHVSKLTCVEDTTGVEFCDAGDAIGFGRKRATGVFQELLTLCYNGVGIGFSDE